MISKPLIFIIGVALLFIFGFYNNFNSWLQTQFNGPEYCFKDITKSDISVASQGVSVSYTKSQGDELCFRTKDFSIVERLNEQIQDRKLQAQLEEIKSRDKFMNETLPGIIVIIVGAILILMIIYLLTNQNKSHY